MADSVYKVITLIGTSSEPWERAAAAAVQRASATLQDLRVAEVRELDMLLEDGADVVQGVRSLGVAGDLDPLPGGQPGRRGRAVRRREPRVLL